MVLQTHIHDLRFYKLTYTTHMPHSLLTLVAMLSSRLCAQDYAPRLSRRNASLDPLRTTVAPTCVLTPATWSAWIAQITV